MSNPSGPDHDDTGTDAAAVHDEDPVTEVIDIPADIPSDAAAGEPATGERRYTAPGFDAGSTQIIDRLPDAPTEFIETAGGYGAGGRSAPRAIPPRHPGRRSLWRLLAAVLGAALVAGAVVGALAYKRNADRVATENRVRASIERFDGAIRDGDLSTLRSITCGQTRDNYVGYDDQSWADTYSRILAAKQYPVVASIDEVVVNGDHAEANVTSYMAFDPATRSTRSFDLQFRDAQWKICRSS